MTILVIEDDLAMAAILRQGLEQDDYSVALAHTGWKGLELAQRGECDAIILDVMLPSLDGLSLTKQLREGGCTTPILMLTARDDVSDIVRGLEAGAEDYLTKPFSFLELLARLRVLISGRKSTRPLRVADLALDTGSRTVSRGGVAQSLTRSEFVLLHTLMRHAGQAVPRSEIANAVWGSADGVDQNRIDVLIRALRAHVDDPYSEKLIQTVRGVGYKLAAPGSLP